MQPELMLPAAPEGFSPVALIKRLESLAAEFESCRPWTEQLLAQLSQLTLTRPADQEQIADCLRGLRMGVQAGDQLSERLTDETAAAELRRTVHAVVRRVDLWEQLQAGEPGCSRTQRVQECLTKLAALADSGGPGQDWCRYLLLDELQQRSQQPACDASAALASQILSRMQLAKLTPVQRQFVTSGPVGELHASLYDMAHMELTSRMLKAQVEQYEQTRRASDARVLAASLRRLRWSEQPQDQQLNQAVEQHFRNTNVRFAISQQLLARLVPDQPPRFERVYDRILGLPVRGRSLTQTELELTSLPATGDRQMRFLLSAQGTTSSQTRSTRGSVVAHSNTCARFEAHKQFEMGEQGLVALPAEVYVSTNTRLQNIETSLDRIPLVGSLAREISRSKAAEFQQDAEAEVRAKIAARVRQQLDTETAAAVAQINGPLLRHVLLPVGELALEPAAIVSHPVEDRVSVRVRLASTDQLGAHTPRPRALSNSLASMQIHESALNNFVGQLQLGGETMTTSELVARLALKFRVPAEAVPSLEEDALLRFAKDDPLHFMFEDGSVRLTLHLEEFAADRYAWKDVTVVVNYRPQRQGVGVELTRDGPVQLSARKMSLRSQFLLRGLFSRIFSENRNLQLLQEGWTTQPGLLDLGIAQCVIEDGWIGISLAPRSELPGIAGGRTAHKPLGLRR